MWRLSLPINEERWRFNARIRGDLTKGTRFDTAGEAKRDEYLEKMNNRTRKVLGWPTSEGAFINDAYGPRPRRVALPSSTWGLARMPEVYVQ